MQHPECQRLSAQTSRFLAGGPATLSKHPSRYPAGVTPLLLTAGEGATIWCADGEPYIDCVAALGPILLGHNHPLVTRAVQKQAASLASSTMSTPLEGAVAERLCTMIPGAEVVRTATNGKDVTEAAVKLARYVTGHSCVLYCGYSGGFSDYLCTTDKNGGVLSILDCFNKQIPWRDFDALEKGLVWAAQTEGRPDIAAIVLEVPPELPGVMKEETAAVIQRYADAAHAAGGLFILDEVVTGFRQSLGGAQAYYGVEGDICTFSKAMANGLPISAITGPRELMKCFEGGTVFLSTTFGASPISLAACEATLKTLQETDALSTLLHYGHLTHSNVADALCSAKLPAIVRGNYARFVIDWHGIDGVATAAELRTLWLQELISRGILAGVPWFPLCCYTQETVATISAAVQETCAVMSEVVAGTKAISEALHGPAISDVFQRYEPAKESQHA